MKKNRFLRLGATFFLISGLFSVSLTSCNEKEEDKVKPVTITDIILKNEEFSMLRDIMLSAELSDGLRSQSYTLFAPNNAAFNRANIFSSSIITTSKASSLAFLQNHILKQRFQYQDLKVGTAEALGTKKLTITKVDSVITVNQSAIIMKDVNASNGVIQVIDSVLVR